MHLTMASQALCAIWWREIRGRWLEGCSFSGQAKSHQQQYTQEVFWTVLSVQWKLRPSPTVRIEYFDYEM